MRFLPMALAITGLSSSVWAAEPQWTWMDVMSTGQGLRTEQGTAEVTITKRSLQISFFREGSTSPGHGFRGTLGPPRDRPRFKNIVGLDAAGSFTTVGTDYNDKTPMRGTYL